MKNKTTICYSKLEQQELKTNTCTQNSSIKTLYMIGDYMSHYCGNISVGYRSWVWGPLKLPKFQHFIGSDNLIDVLNRRQCCNETLPDKNLKYNTRLLQPINLKMASSGSFPNKPISCVQQDNCLCPPPPIIQRTRSWAYVRHIFKCHPP